MALGNTEYPQTSAKQTNAKLDKLSVAKIKGESIKQRTVGAFCQLFSAKEQRKALKGKPDRNS